VVRLLDQREGGVCIGSSDQERIRRKTGRIPVHPRASGECDSVLRGFRMERVGKDKLTHYGAPIERREYGEDKNHWCSPRTSTAEIRRQWIGAEIDLLADQDSLAMILGVLGGKPDPRTWLDIE